MTQPTETSAPDAIVKATDKIDSALDSVGTKGGEVANLVGVLVTHLNNLLSALYYDVRVGVKAADSGIGGIATLTVSTEDALKAAATQSSEPLATPPAGLTPSA